MSAVHWRTWQIRLYAEPISSTPSRMLRQAIPNGRSLTRSEHAFRDELGAGHLSRRPSTDLECQAIGLGESVPCPFVLCPHHLGINVTPNGSLQVVYPHWEDGAQDDVPTCSLTEARNGAKTAGEVGDVLGIGINRVRQIEIVALAKVARALGVDEGELRRTLAKW